jgi:hypothetical protein
MVWDLREAQPADTRSLPGQIKRIGHPALGKRLVARLDISRFLLGIIEAPRS